MHRLSVCCLLPDTALARDPCHQKCCVAHPRTGSAFAESIVVDCIRRFPLVGPEASSLREPGYAAATATVPASDALPRAVGARLSTRAAVAILPR